MSTAVRSFKTAAAMSAVAVMSAAVILTLGFTGCGVTDTEPESRVEDGALKGSSWEQKTSEAPIPASGRFQAIPGWDLTRTLKFTSDKNATWTETGWTGTTGNKTNVNETVNLTYIYAPSLLEGYVERSNGNKTLFSISSDFKSLTYGGASVAYIRK